MTRLLAIAGISVALAFAGCGGDGDEDPNGETAAAEETASGGESPGEQGRERERPADREEPPGITITTGDSQFGAVLFDGNEQAIYYFDKERASESECYGGCAAAWPPVLTKGEPQGRGQVRTNMLGTTERDDGTTQVTYDRRPLYYYVNEGPAEVRCHNVQEFGGLWLAVQPNGDPVPTDA